VTEYINTLAQEGGWDADSTKAVLKAIGENPKAAEMFKRDVMARQDYSRDKDALKTDRDAFDASQVEHKKKEAEWLKFHAELKAIEAQQQATGGGDNFDNSNDGQDNSDGEKPLTRKEMNDALKARDNTFVDFVKTTTILGQEHQANFGEPLPVLEVEKYAVEHQLPLKEAYKDFIAPRLEKKREEVFEAAKKSSYEEGVLKGRSEQQSPPDAGATGGSEFLQNTRATIQAKEGEKPDGLAAFAEGWAEAAAKASP
ncbi:hypothetical protein LCGC14_3054510, partial [marine sediment metagenome]